LELLSVDEGAVGTESQDQSAPQLASTTSLTDKLIQKLDANQAMLLLQQMLSNKAPVAFGGSQQLPFAAPFSPQPISFQINLPSPQMATNPTMFGTMAPAQLTFVQPQLPTIRDDQRFVSAARQTETSSEVQNSLESQDDANLNNNTHDSILLSMDEGRISTTSSGYSGKLAFGPGRHSTAKRDASSTASHRWKSK
jgi:hypothetical protein